ncbi:hypothetical protein CJ739_82 [Mariniflexile rhizosphaerae]|uniref:hypothetical protein n=1 Tax=unclassified Mariniflexile TaxID=2643887 RepID=UPI000E332F66|nr:hypothetical protein [Mariniflexile sp. TRM1-10]AXP79182.1 hypothetical protein CJ739_82 [Mariniflexile sp. TRM1-10]
MSKFFDLNKKKQAVETPEFKEKFESKYLLQHFQKLENLDKDLQRLPTVEEFFFLQTEKSFNAFTFIPFVCQYERIKHLYASTYSIGSKVVNALIELHDTGFIDEITLLISDSMIKRNPVTIDNLCSMAASRGNVNVLFSWVHAKVCILETKTNHYIIEGSGNWSENAQYEQYLFGNSKGVFDFRKELFTNTKIIKNG